MNLTAVTVLSSAVDIAKVVADKEWQKENRQASGL